MWNIWVKRGNKVGITEVETGLNHPLSTYGWCVFRIRTLVVSEADLPDRSAATKVYETESLVNTRTGAIQMGASSSEFENGVFP